MKVEDALEGVSSIFLDTAPVIYYVQGNPQYADIVNSIFNQIDTGNLRTITSPVTLAECLVIPYRMNQTKLQQDFMNVLTNGDNTTLALIDGQIAQQASKLRAQYNIGLLDALQFGVALATGCSAFLTNDIVLQRVAEIKVIVIDDLEM